MTAWTESNNRIGSVKKDPVINKGMGSAKKTSVINRGINRGKLIKAAMNWGLDADLTEARQVMILGKG